MNKTAIKNFAIWARVQLIESAKQRAFEYEITEDGDNKYSLDAISGRVLTADEKNQRNQLISLIKARGYEQVMEEAAYTWFNRFIALRFMEVNGYLPSKIRIFTDENNTFKPEILKEAMYVEMDGLDRNRVFELIEKQNDEELYKLLIITQCNALNSCLPLMFEHIANWTELLFPSNLLRQDSIIGRMVNIIPEEDWRDQVQIIGWLYQYYNAEPKDKVFENLKKNIKISKENIPAATQLFTPDWIVRYMVENSLGRLWVEGHPNDELKSNWKYYLEEAEQERSVQEKLAEIRKEYAALKPEEIKVIDPCMGSGHILVYMFDVLIQIYESYGYDTREAAGLILKNNLYGLDIDDRASQLAYFAVMMKARQYDRRIFSRGIQPHVYAIVESNGISRDLIDYFEDGRADLKNALETIITELNDAKEYGSILNVTQVDFAAIYARLEEIKEDISMFALPAQTELRPLIEVAETMAQKYHTVVTNPPYMGLSNATAKLNDYINSNYQDAKADLFSVFMLKCKNLTSKNGLFAMITMHSWMFLSSFEKLRIILTDRTNLINMVHLGMRAFSNDVGTIVQTAAFVFSNNKIDKYAFSVADVTNAPTPEEKESAFIDNNTVKCTSYRLFKRLPNTIFAYWATENVARAFSNTTKIENVSETRIGMATANNDRFMRLWHEVSSANTLISAPTREDAQKSHKKWFPYCKGGAYRKWYGNQEYFVNWENDGFEIQHFTDEKTGRIRSHNYNLDYIFKPGLTFTAISNDFSCRTMQNALFGSGGSGICAIKSENYYGLLGLLNSKIILYMMKILSQTMNFEVNQVGSIPFFEAIKKDPNVEVTVSRCIELSKVDWDSFETSWDFKRHPLVCGAKTVSEAYAKWDEECNTRFNQLKANEEELNRIFIDIYGLQDELTAEVEDKDVTVRKADLQRDIKSLISYAVGCMFGRYSLDVDGLAYAGGDWDASKYATFPADKDNIIPICDDEYFDDDIVARFVKFIETVYGNDTLEENLRFIADALGGKGASRDVIRSYFLNDFYADHLKIYQKRPIYWLFDSGKKGGFKALIYMHRYQPDILAKIRTDYVHEQQARYRTAIADLENRIASASTSERVKLNKQLQKIQDQASEIQKYEEKIHHLADQMISIDLDDGVKVNYEKFQDVLAKIK